MNIYIYSIYLKTFTLNLNLKQFTTGVLVQEKKVNLRKKVNKKVIKIN